jgi:hypothetical protein
VEAVDEVTDQPDAAVEHFEPPLLKATRMLTFSQGQTRASPIATSRHSRLGRGEQEGAARSQTPAIASGGDSRDQGRGPCSARMAGRSASSRWALLTLRSRDAQRRGWQSPSPRKAGPAPRIPRARFRRTGGLTRLPFDDGGAAVGRGGGRILGGAARIRGRARPPARTCRGRRTASAAGARRLAR